MNRCPITYELIHERRYSEKGLKLLSARLKELYDFPYSAKEQMELALQFAAKLSIQGVLPKLSVRLNVVNGLFEVVETGGAFIVKPPHQFYDEVPENEDITMQMAKIFGIDVPLHGLMYNKDRTKSYFIKRFDRIAKGHKVAVEDFAQLLQLSRDTKYSSSMEKVAFVLEKHCTFPLLEKQKLFRRILFCFLVGNEDMHLKNFSLIRHQNRIAQVSFDVGYDKLSDPEFSSDFQNRGLDSGRAKPTRAIFARKEQAPSMESMQFPGNIALERYTQKVSFDQKSKEYVS